MNTDTGEIKPVEQLTKKQLVSGKWIEVPDEHMRHLNGMNRKARREYLRENGLFKSGKWGWR